MDILFLIIGLIVGAAIGWLLARSNQKTTGISQDEIENKYVHLSRFEDLKTTSDQIKMELKDQENENGQLLNDLGTWRERYKNLEERLNEKSKEMAELQEKFKNDFKVLAQEILDQNSKKFTEHNKTQIDTILSPFKEKLESFEKKVDENYEKGQKERITLKTEVKGLMDLNEKLNKEAQNLTKALKGDVKTQGNWGEVILERILEKSGLIKDREYFVQNSITTDDGKRFQPDVIIHLPDNKKVIVDSKVSLIAYERFSSAEDINEQNNHLKEHVSSIKAHVKGLQSKNYQNLYGIDGLDFVLMFIPIEGAFSAAVQTDNGLFQDAFDKNVVLVSTSTLLATLRTIASIWKQEQQSQNAIEIARQGGDLYDKFVAFTEDLLSLGKQLNTTKTSYDSAMNKLSEGKGNLVKRAEKMRKLGLKTTKDMNPRLIDRSED